jgi:hypothetical protein
MAFRVVRPDELEWTTRPHEPDEAPRHVAELSELAGFADTRASSSSSRRRFASASDSDTSRL